MYLIGLDRALPHTRQSYLLDYGTGLRKHVLKPITILVIPE